MKLYNFNTGSLVIETQACATECELKSRPLLRKLDIESYPSQASFGGLLGEVALSASTEWHEFVAVYSMRKLYIFTCWSILTNRKVQKKSIKSGIHSSNDPNRGEETDECSSSRYQSQNLSPLKWVIHVIKRSTRNQQGVGQSIIFKTIKCTLYNDLRLVHKLHWE